MQNESQPELRRLEQQQHSTGLGGNAVLSLKKELNTSNETLESIDNNVIKIHRSMDSYMKVFTQLADIQKTTNDSLSEMSDNLDQNLEALQKQNAETKRWSEKIINSVKISFKEYQKEFIDNLNDRKASRLSINSDVFTLVGRSANQTVSSARTFQEFQQRIMLGTYELNRNMLIELISIRKSADSTKADDIRKSIEDTSNKPGAIRSTAIAGKAVLSAIPGAKLLGSLASILLDPVQLKTKLSQSIYDLKIKTGLMHKDRTGIDTLKAAGLHKTSQERAYGFIGDALPKLMDEFRRLDYQKVELLTNIFEAINDMSESFTGKRRELNTSLYAKEKEAREFDPLTQEYYDKNEYSKLQKVRIKQATDELARNRNWFLNMFAGALGGETNEELATKAIGQIGNQSKAEQEQKQYHRKWEVFDLEEADANLARTLINATAVIGGLLTGGVGAAVVAGAAGIYGGKKAAERFVPGENPLNLAENYEPGEIDPRTNRPNGRTIRQETTTDSSDAIFTSTYEELNKISLSNSLKQIDLLTEIRDAIRPAGSDDSSLSTLLTQLNSGLGITPNLPESQTLLMSYKDLIDSINKGGPANKSLTLLQDETKTAVEALTTHKDGTKGFLPNKDGVKFISGEAGMEIVEIKPDGSYSVRNKKQSAQGEIQALLDKHQSYAEGTKDKPMTEMIRLMSEQNKKTDFILSDLFKSKKNDGIKTAGKTEDQIHNEKIEDLQAEQVSTAEATRSDTSTMCGILTESLKLQQKAAKPKKEEAKKGLLESLFDMIPWKTILAGAAIGLIGAWLINKISDWFKGMDFSLAGAGQFLSDWFLPTNKGPGTIWEIIDKSMKWGLAGATAGFLIGGPIGALLGLIVAGIGGGIAAWLGTDKINNFLSEKIWQPLNEQLSEMKQTFNIGAKGWTLGIAQMIMQTKTALSLPSTIINAYKASKAAKEAATLASKVAKPAMDMAKLGGKALSVGENLISNKGIITTLKNGITALFHGGLTSIKELFEGGKFLVKLKSLFSIKEFFPAIKAIFSGASRSNPVTAIIFGIIDIVLDTFKSIKISGLNVSSIFKGLTTSSEGGGFMSALKGMGKYGAIGAGIGWTAGLIGGPLAFLTGGAGYLIGSIIGLVLGWFGDLKIADAWESIKEKFSEWMFDIKTTITDLFHGGFGRIWTDIKNKFSDTIDSVGTSIHEMWDSVTQPIKDFWNQDFSGLFISSMVGISDLFSGKNIGKLAGKLIDGVGSILSTIVEFVAGLFGDEWGARAKILTNTIGLFFDKMGHFFSGIPDMMGGWVLGFYNGLSPSFQKLLPDSVVSWIKSLGATQQVKNEIETGLAGASTSKDKMAYLDQQTAAANAKIDESTSILNEAKKAKADADAQIAEELKKSSAKQDMAKLSALGETSSNADKIIKAEEENLAISKSASKDKLEEITYQKKILMREEVITQNVNAAKTAELIGQFKDDVYTEISIFDTPEQKLEYINKRLEDKKLAPGKLGAYQAIKAELQPIVTAHENKVKREKAEEGIDSTAKQIKELKDENDKLTETINSTEDETQKAQLIEQQKELNSRIVNVQAQNDQFKLDSRAGRRAEIKEPVENVIDTTSNIGNSTSTGLASSMTSGAASVGKAYNEKGLWEATKTAASGGYNYAAEGIGNLSSQVQQWASKYINKGWSKNYTPEVESIIDDAAKKYNLDPNFLKSVAYIESGGDPSISHSAQGAKGLFQFVDGTWGELGKGKNVFDPAANADAAARYFVANGKILQKAKLAITPTNLYMMHQQGAGGGRQLIKAAVNDSTDISAGLKSNMAGQNPKIFSGASPREYLSSWGSVIGGIYKKVSGKLSNIDTTPTAANVAAGTGTSSGGLMNSFKNFAGSIISPAAASEAPADTTLYSGASKPSEADTSGGSSPIVSGPQPKSLADQVSAGFSKVPDAGTSSPSSPSSTQPMPSSMSSQVSAGIKGFNSGPNQIPNVKLTNSGVQTGKIHPEVYKRLAGLAAKYKQITGKDVVINSAWRSQEKQAALKANAKDKKMVGTPGGSMHQWGYALDLIQGPNYSSPQGEELARTIDPDTGKSLLSSFGFARPLLHMGPHPEPWHIEPMEIVKSRFQIPDGFVPKLASGNYLSAESMGFKGAAASSETGAASPGAATAEAGTGGATLGLADLNPMNIMKDLKESWDFVKFASRRAFPGSASAATADGTGESEGGPTTAQQQSVGDVVKEANLNTKTKASQIPTYSGPSEADIYKARDVELAAFDKDYESNSPKLSDEEDKKLREWYHDNNSAGGGMFNDADISKAPADIQALAAKNTAINIKLDATKSDYDKKRQAIIDKADSLNNTRFQADKSTDPFFVQENLNNVTAKTDESLKSAVKNNIYNQPQKEESVSSDLSNVVQDTIQNSSSPTVFNNGGNTVVNSAKDTTSAIDNFFDNMFDLTHIYLVSSSKTESTGNFNFMN